MPARGGLLTTPPRAPRPGGRLPGAPLALAALWALLPPAPPAAAAAPYELRDLRALSDAGHHGELLRHARDVRPSERDGAWRAMVVRAAREAAGEALDKGDLGRDALALLGEAAAWPELARDAVFHARRDAHLVRWLARCLGEEPFAACQEGALKAFRRGPANPETGVRLAGALARANPEARVLDFASKAAGGGFGGFYCARPFLARALLDRLRVLAAPLSDPRAVADAVDGVMGEGCFGTFAKTLLKILSSGRPGERDLAHKILSAKGALPRGDRDLHLARVLLGPPRTGRVFNLAWAVMGEVARDRGRRMELVDRLARLDPLPDRVFADGGSLRARTVAARLRDTLPEYLARYAQTCLDYLAGGGRWPRGNPTVHCDGFFRATEGLAVPSDGARLRHGALRRFASPGEPGLAHSPSGPGGRRAVARTPGSLGP